MVLTSTSEKPIQTFSQLAAPTQTTHSGEGNTSTGNRSGGAGDHFTGNQGQENADRGQSRFFALTREYVETSNGVYIGTFSFFL